MVSVGTGFLYNLYRLVKINSPQRKKTYQLWNHHRRMGIINLNHRVIWQIVKGTPFFLALIQNQLRSVADHKILLINPKLPPLIITVIWIEEQGQIFGNILFVKRNSLFHNPLIHGLHIKQMKPVSPVPVSGHSNIIQSGMNGQIPKLHGIRNLPGNQPAFLFNPWIGGLFLQFILKFLLEQSKMVVKSNSSPIQPQSCHGIQKTRRQTSQSAIAKGRFRLSLLNLA